MRLVRRPVQVEPMRAAIVILSLVLSGCWVSTGGATMPDPSRVPACNVPRISEAEHNARSINYPEAVRRESADRACKDYLLRIGRVNYRAAGGR